MFEPRWLIRPKLIPYPGFRSIERPRVVLLPWICCSSKKRSLETRLDDWFLSCEIIVRIRKEVNTYVPSSFCAICCCPIASRALTSRCTVAVHSFLEQSFLVGVFSSFHILSMVLAFSKDGLCLASKLLRYSAETSSLTPRLCQHVLTSSHIPKSWSSVTTVSLALATK